MNLQGDRAAIASALDTVTGVNGYGIRPSTPKRGDAWPILGALTRDAAYSYAVSWSVFVFIGGNEQSASEWLDANLDEIDDALRSVGFIDTIEPANLGNSETQPSYGLMITMRSE